MAPLMIRFLRPPICPPFIFATVIPTPVASIPDSVIVTAVPTLTLFLNVAIPATSKIPVLTLSVAAIPVKFAPLIAGNVPVKFAAGKLDTTGTWATHIKAVKDANPKPS